MGDPPAEPNVPPYHSMAGQFPPYPAAPPGQPMAALLAQPPIPPPDPPMAPPSHGGVPPHPPTGSVGIDEIMPLKPQRRAYHGLV